MPGLLRPEATCPQCANPLLMLVDTTHGFHNGRAPEIAVTREYFHEKPAFGRRKRPCINKFRNYGIAQRERRNLEV